MTRYSVLYVDDEQVLLDLGKTFLERSGSLTVGLVTSAGEAIEKLKTTSFDCIVSDYQMPGMDGIAFLKYIRTAYPELPFILFTGRGREEVVIEAFANNADFYLQKGGNATAQFVELEHKIKLAIERRQTAKALRESEVRYRAVVESQTEMISRFLPDGTHIFVNDAYSRYFRKTPGEIIGSRFHPDTTPEDSILICKHLASLTPAHPQASLEHAITMPDGEIRWQEWIDLAVFDDLGNLKEYQSVGRDITDRKRAEEALRKSQFLLEDAMEQARMAYWEFDVLRATFTFNDRFYRLLGTTAEREGGYLMPAGVYVREFIHPDDRGVFASITEEVKKASDSVLLLQREHRIIRRDGSLRYVIVRLNISKDAGGDQTRSHGHGSIQDITGMRVAENALCESEEKYRGIMENIQDVYYRTDAEGNLIMASPSGLRMFGFVSLSDIFGKNISKTFYKDPGERMKFLDELEMKGSVTDYEITLRRKDGSLVPVSTSSHKCFDPLGKFLGIEGIFRDVSARKSSETALKAALERITAAEESLRVQYEEMKKNTEALHTSELMYRSLFENTGTAMVIIDEDRVITLANAEFVKLSGYTKEEIEGKIRWTETVLPEDLDRMLSQHKQRREGGKDALKRYEFRFVTRSGDVRTISLTIDLIPGTSRSVASLMDVTEAKRDADRLRESEERCRMLIENLTAGHSGRERAA